MNLNYKIRVIFIVLILIIAFTHTPFANAQTLNIDYPAVPVPGPGGVVWFDINNAVEAEKLDIIGLLVYIYAIILWLAAIITFILITYTGARFIISGSSAGVRNQSKKQFYNIAWGVLILLFSWYLLNFINPNITDIEQSLFLRGVFDPNPVYESPITSTYIEGGTDPAIAGTFSCEWTGDGCVNVQPDNCNAGYYAIDCTQIEDDGFCNGIQNVACTQSVSTGGGGGGSGASSASCANGEEPPPPDTGSRQALCSTGTECEPWCYEPKGSGNKGPAEILRTDPQYAEEWPAIYPSSCTVALETLRGQWGGSESGWMRVEATNDRVAGYEAFLTGLQNAGAEAKEQGYLLNMFSGYRPLYDQVRVLCWNEGRNASPSAMQSVLDAGLVAKPGRSPHGVGVAVDVELRTSSGSYMSRICEYKKQLKKIMFDSDPNWYRLSNEYWHFEYWPGGPPNSSRVRDYGTC